MGQLDDQSRYVQQLVTKKKFVQLEHIAGVYALVDRRNGSLSNKWLLVEEREFVDGENRTTLLVCDCIVGHENKERLSSITSLITNESLTSFETRESQLYCEHCKAVQILRIKAKSGNVSSEKVEVIDDSPFVAVCNGGSRGYGMITAGHHQFKCQSCKDIDCDHLEIFASWNSEIDEDAGDLSQVFSKLKLSRDSARERFKCISSKPIPCPHLSRCNH